MNTPPEPTPAQYARLAHLQSIMEREQTTQVEDDLAFLGCANFFHDGEEQPNPAARSVGQRCRVLTGETKFDLCTSK